MTEVNDTDHLLSLILKAIEQSSLISSRGRTRYWFTYILDWIGFPMIVICYFMSTVGGIQLAKSWTIVQERDPTLTGHVRNPYPTIGKHAFGKIGE